MSRQSKLTALMAAGKSLYPSSMGAIEFRPVPSGKAWGSGRGMGMMIAAGSPGIPSNPGGIGAVAASKVETAKKKFAEWVRRKHPALFDAAVTRVNQSTNLGAEESFFDKLTNAFTAIAPEYLRAKAQRDLLEVQLERAKQGLPPLETSQYAPAVQVSVDPNTVRDSIATAGASLGQKLGPLVWIVPAAVVGFLLLRK